MDSCEKEFESAGQEARRLAIALKRFTEVQDPVWKEKYQHYLSLRFRPAISELIRQDDFFRISLLSGLSPDKDQPQTSLPGEH